MELLIAPRPFYVIQAVIKSKVVHSRTKCTLVHGKWQGGDKGITGYGDMYCLDMYPYCLDRRYDVTSDVVVRSSGSPCQL